MYDIIDLDQIDLNKNVLYEDALKIILLNHLDILIDNSLLTGNKKAFKNLCNFRKSFVTELINLGDLNQIQLTYIREIQVCLSKNKLKVSTNNLNFIEGTLKLLQRW